MRHQMSGDEQYIDVTDEERTNDELITKLSEEYERALRSKDRERIDDNIAPRFWSRFAPYFNEYRALWVGGETDDYERTGDRFLLDRSDLGKVQEEWMDQVLRGEIELGDEMDEEPSEY